MTTRVSIIFPYVGDDNDIREKLTQILELVEKGKAEGLHTSNMKPVLIVNKDTINRGLYEKFQICLRRRRKEYLLDPERLDVLEAWAVDTCQMWLHGFGKILDDKNENREDSTSCILQIPGDLKYVKDFRAFVRELSSLGARTERRDWLFAIGDFEVEPERSKHLIDTYGTYPLLFNWFPEIAARLQEKGIRRPRSEFLAADLQFLREILSKRKFAYEQTLAILIHALSAKDKGWSIDKVDLGAIGDYEPGRGFREANDQIERTERMLKFLWRELNKGDDFDVVEFARLDRRSTSIREAAIVSLQNFLGKFPSKRSRGGRPGATQAKRNP